MKRGGEPRKTQKHHVAKYSPAVFKNKRWVFTRISLLQMKVKNWRRGDGATSGGLDIFFRKTGGGVVAATEGKKGKKEVICFPRKGPVDGISASMKKGIRVFSRVGARKKL